VTPVSHGLRLLSVESVAGGFTGRAVYSRPLEKMRLDHRCSPGKFTKHWLVPRGCLGAL
jgi:hypothetical protein